MYNLSDGCECDINSSLIGIHLTDRFSWKRADNISTQLHLPTNLNISKSQPAKQICAKAICLSANTLPITSCYPLLSRPSVSKCPVSVKKTFSICICNNEICLAVTLPLVSTAQTSATNVTTWCKNFGFISIEWK